ncbi:MAG: hypothetical protein WC683_09675 [bacterium]
MSVFDELEKLSRKHKGALRPRDVVNFARDPKTALHEHFEWDDNLAAEEYRLEQARKIIRVQIIQLDGHPLPIRAYVSLEKDRGRDSYRPITRVLEDKMLRAELMAQALREAKAWALRYEQLEELAEVFSAIEKIAS